jgi:hypothetical protein
MGPERFYSGKEEQGGTFSGRSQMENPLLTIFTVPGVFISQLHIDAAQKRATAPAVT